MKWIDKHIEVEPSKKPKKITGTRFASVLGANLWETPFKTWCAITRTYEEPFVDSIYTVAGKTIEPKQIAYMRESYGMDNLITPTDMYGENFFQNTWGDFFSSDHKVFGGMWDSLLVDDGKTEAVLEFKTTKRVEDWQGDKIPEYYALQASLYAWLLGCDDVIMVCSVLQEKDYTTPDNYEPSVENTFTREFKVSERYPNFDRKVESAMEFWNNHVLTGISPDYDEKKDADILKVLRTNNVNPDTNLQELIDEAEELKGEIDRVEESIAPKAKRLKNLTDQVKALLIEQIGADDKKAEVVGARYVWGVSKSDSTGIDKDALEKDGLLDKYTKVSTSYRISIKEAK